MVFHFAYELLQLHSQIHLFIKWSEQVVNSLKTKNNEIIKIMKMKVQYVLQQQSDPEINVFILGRILMILLLKTCNAYCYSHVSVVQSVYKQNNCTAL